MSVDTESSVSDVRPEASPRVLARLRRAGGGVGSIRVVLVLAFIWTVFGISNPAFLSSANLTNLALQIAAIGVVSIGVVLILLLGEIDVSVGSVSGMCAGLTGVLSVTHGWPAWAAILAGIAAGAAVGLIQGVIVTWLAIPSFVVTLAGYLGWAGVQLAIVGAAGTISITDGSITGLANTFIPYWLSWVSVVLAVLGVFALALFRRRRRQSLNLEVNPLYRDLFGPVAVSTAALLGVGVLNWNRGVPVSLGILVVLIFCFSVLITRTRFGQHVLATGGNEEAARRAGIPVKRVKLLIFAIGSALAAAGGILAMARLLSVDASAGSGNFLLYAIAGPIIAGVSLFGGRGSVWAALLGAVIIGSVQNGMNLLSLPASTQAIVTALVLLVAVVIDALTRRRRQLG